ncbi:MAG: DUF1080 domain-containing protein [Saprospiraceae bacterium]
MQKLIIYSVIGVITLLLICSCEGKKLTFGENIKEWEVYGDADWNFSNDELRGKVDNGDGFVITQQSYKNFTLEVEFKPDSTINSGIFIRCQKEDAINPMDCYELNIWDLHPEQDSRTGAIVTRAKPLAYVETIDKWNTYKIKVENAFIKVWINDVLTADVRSNALSEGYIGLQAKGTGEVSFRNLKINTITE